ncbi:uncharacterized protein N0V89_005655 [Didymosphaeria variabile]|uniref:Uncharacterized protein n=1 Tax=Didymosphaeria variabile TaxID=1932322 RepID=A0A9W8XM32_9PLEO|nr:uncharacterized protein N0V89_005655 [Didymosphaeria variabile]KAJ4353924.1 hypothetical protein N0V89_005655 [Didymosphaeria variabile]
MSLKRLLNPDDGTNEYEGPRPLQGWDDYGVPTEAIPVLQETSWDNCVADIFPLDSLPDILGQDQLDCYNQQDDFNVDAKRSLLFVEEQVQRWAEDNVSSQPTSSPASQGSDEEKICYGLVRITSLIKALY